MVFLPCSLTCEYKRFDAISCHSIELTMYLPLKDIKITVSSTAYSVLAIAYTIGPVDQTMTTFVRCSFVIQ